MRLIIQMTKVKRWLSTGIATQHPVKHLGGLALGVLLVAGMGLSFSLTDADNPGSLSTKVGAESNNQERLSPRWEEDDGDHIPYAVNPLQYLGIVESSPSSESVFPRWEEDDGDHIPYAVNPIQYLGIVESSPSSESVFPRWEEDDADHIPYAVNPIQDLGITD